MNYPQSTMAPKKLVKKAAPKKAKRNLKVRKVSNDGATSGFSY